MTHELQGFKFLDAPIKWEFQPVEPRWKSAANRFARFKDNWQFSPVFKTWERSIIVFGHRMDFITAYHGDGFYIQAEKSYGNIIGPHAVRLLYRSSQFPSEYAWVAILQVTCMWWADARFKAAVIEAINTNEFYQSEKSGNELVLL